MHNELLHIGPLTVYGYGFMIAMGVLAAWFVAEQRARKLKLACEHIFYLVVWCAIGGFTSAKILFWITNWREFLQNPRQIIGSDGFVVYGGIIGGILVGWLYCRIKKLKFLEYFDLMMPSIALAQGFGRIGCFLAGCCYGCPSTSWWGVTFPAGGIAPAGIPLIPTQLISAGGDFLLAAVLILFSRHAKRSGDVGAAYLVLYGIGRFLIEFLRNDERGSVSLLSTSQFISLFILAGGVVLFWSNFHRGRKEVPSKSSL